jgi:EIN3-binding F-box protein
MTSIRKAEFCNEKTVNPDSDESSGYLTRCLEGKKATDLRLAAISVGTSSRGGLKKLSIRNSTRGVTNLGLSAIARGCPSLKALSLWNVPKVGDEGLIEIAKECRLLEKLDLCQCPSISNKGLISIAENCPNLNSLNIESCANIGNKGLQAIGKFCSKLQFISINNCPLVGDHGVTSLLSSASSITKVKLQGLNVTDFSLAVIGHYGKAITNLVLCGLQNVSEKGFWVMGNAQGLKKMVSLTISSCRGVTDVSLGAIGKGCMNLKQMCLRKCCFVSDSGLVAFAEAAKSLESLQLEECNRISQNGVIGALSNLKSLTLVKCMGIKETPLEIPVPGPCDSLRSLCVRNCPAFDNTSLAFIEKLCPQLQHIELSNLNGITDTGLLPLLESCEAGLVKVNLNGCLNVTDRVVSSLANLHGSTLEILNLDGCRKITDLSLMAMADKCMFLSDLDLSKCAVTDSGIAALSQLNLQILSLSGCSEVSNKSVPFLKKIGRTLVGLNLQHCNSLYSGSIEVLVESLWRCDVLF